MDWHKLYPSDIKPTMDEIADYMGEARELWLSLIDYIETTYKTKSKLTYSGCGMKPGWNIKYQKSGQAFGTLYPQKNAFDVMVVISYKLDPVMEERLPLLSKQTADLYRSAGDYMKLGKYMMLNIHNRQTLEDYKNIIAVKLPPPIASRV